MARDATTTDTTRERPSWPAFVAITALALVVRFVYLLEARAVPLFHAPIVDAKSYWDWSERIVAGDWKGSEVFYQAPLYPYFLACVKLAVGSDLWRVRLVQIVLGALACGVLFLAAKELVARRVGLVAGAMLALYPPAIFFDSLIQKANLGLVWTVLLLWTIAHAQRAPGAMRVALAGLFLGLLMLTREETLLLVPVLASWVLVAFRATPIAMRARWLAALAIGVALPLLPVALRNRAVGGEFVLTTSQAGTNFFIGNGPAATGIYVPLRAGRSDTAYERVDAKELAERASGKTLTPSEVSRFWFARAFEHVREHTSAWLAVVARKAMLALNAYEVPDAEDLYWFERSSIVLRALGFAWHFGVLLPLAAAGAWLAWPRRRELGIVMALSATMLAGVVTFYVMARYRYPLVPGLVVLAAFGLVEAVERVRARRASSLAIPGIVFVVLALLANVTIYPRDSQRATSLHNDGVALIKLNRSAEAVDALRAAVELKPEQAESWGKLGEAQKELGRVDDALASFDTAAKLRTENWRYPWQIGVLRMQKGDAQGAIAAFEHATSLAGAGDEAWKSLAGASQSIGEWSRAIAAWRKARELDPRDVGSTLQLAFLLATCPDDALRNGEEGLSLARTIDERTGGIAQLDVLAAALAETGRYSEALTTVRRAIATAESKHDTALVQVLRSREAAYARNAPFRTSATSR